MPKGTVQVDFAGTRTEAQAFAAANGLNCSNRLRSPGEGYPVLSIPYTSVEGERAARRRFEALGWDDEFQHTSYHTTSVSRE